MVRPEATRAQDEVFIGSCSFSALLERLPLVWPKPPDTPASPKLSYRSSYQYLGWEELENPAVWQQWDDFELLRRLVDFSPLRDVLAERLGWTSAQGQVAFDPVSLCLLTFWQISTGWSRAEILRNLRTDRYSDYATLFGFRAGVFPSEGGLRYFLTTLGKNSTAPGQRRSQPCGLGKSPAVPRWSNSCGRRPPALPARDRELLPACSPSLSGPRKGVPGL